MYLVHARLLPPRPSAALPDLTRTWITAASEPQDRVEHVAAHPDASPYPVLGLYLLADDLETAEARAAALCRRVLRGRPELAGWALVDAGAPLVAAFHDWQPAGPAARGHNRPGTDPSS